MQQSRPRASLQAVLAHIVSEPAEYHAALRKDAFRTFKIPKKDGGKRTIHAPSGRLKLAQREALRAMAQAGYLTPQTCDHGFVTKRGIHTLLKAITPARRILQGDLGKAFHQIKEEDVKAWATKNGADSRTARWLSRGTCREVEGLEGRRLVMGSPLAPALLLELTAELRAATERLARVYRGTCTWYADNVVFEVPARFRGQLLKAFQRLVTGQRWTLKDAPAECPKVLGWTFWGLLSQPHRTAPKGSGLGWRADRKQRKAARGRLRRLDSGKSYYLDHGWTLRATKLGAKAQGLRHYLSGPAKGSPLAPNYVPARL